MGDSAMAVVAIFLAAILMFVFPLMTMADKKDDVNTLAIQKITDEFVNTVKTTGKLTQEQYDNYMQTLAATGNAYKVDITIKRSDDNPAKKEVEVNYSGIGEKVYYDMYTTQVLDALKKEGRVLTLNEGDIISVTANNTNKTIGMQLRDFLYRVTGNNSNTVTASSSGMVTTNGQ